MVVQDVRDTTQIILLQELFLSLSFASFPRIWPRNRFPPHVTECSDVIEGQLRSVLPVDTT
jgi:hypothetical protein